MGSFFKRFGKGILYVIICPFSIAALVIFSIYGLGLFLYMGVKTIILFFSGRSLKDDLPEDIRAKEILNANAIKPEENLPKEQPKEILSVYPSDSTMYNSPYNELKQAELSNPKEMPDISIDEQKEDGVNE